MQASNRILQNWYRNVRLGEIELPRFQRFEAWDRQRIASLMQFVIHNLPLDITLWKPTARKTYLDAASCPIMNTLEKDDETVKARDHRLNKP